MCYLPAWPVVLLQDGSMQEAQTMPAPAPYIAGYVKVEIRSRLPKTWSWSIHREANGIVIEHSNDAFKYAEDAWKAGQVALNSLSIPADAA
jgi:hypothetical protein